MLFVCGRILVFGKRKERGKVGNCQVQNFCLEILKGWDRLKCMKWINLAWGTVQRDVITDRGIVFHGSCLVSWLDVQLSAVLSLKWFNKSCKCRDVSKSLCVRVFLCLIKTSQNNTVQLPLHCIHRALLKISVQFWILLPVRNISCGVQINLLYTVRFITYRTVNTFCFSYEN